MNNLLGCLVTRPDAGRQDGILCLADAKSRFITQRFHILPAAIAVLPIMMLWAGAT